MTRVLFIATVLLSGLQGVYAQRICCTFLDNIAPNCAYQVIADASPAGYYRFRGVEGCEYNFSHCSGGGSYTGDPYLTISNDNCEELSWNDDACGFGSELIWTCPATGFYQLHMGTFQDGCVALVRSLAFRINSLPPVVVVPTISPICPGEGVQLSILSDFAVNWSPASGLSCTICPNPIASPAVSTTYTASTFDGCCTGTGSITVVVKNAYSVAENVSICEGESYTFGGQEYSESGTYTHVFEAVNACDSTVTLSLDVVQINPVINILGGVLTTPDPGFIYQWIDCTTGFPLSGANSQFFIPEIDGTYAVQISSPVGCFEQSECVFATEIDEARADSDFFAYPNPSSGSVSVFAPALAEVRLTDASGKLLHVLRSPFAGVKTTQIEGLSDGVYFLSQGSRVIKLVVVR